LKVFGKLAVLIVGRYVLRDGVGDGFRVPVVISGKLGSGMPSASFTCVAPSELGTPA
jgi:hypothetical protein